MMSEFRHRHRDDELYDEVNIRCVERWKTSGLSGDEWRFSYVVELRRKGATLWSRGFPSMSTAIAALNWFFLTAGQTDDEFDLNASEATNKLCAQPGCKSVPTVKYYLKKEYSRCGKSEAPSFPIYICFCDKHKRRGDCGLEDSDENYIAADKFAKGE